MFKLKHLALAAALLALGACASNGGGLSLAVGNTPSFSAGDILKTTTADLAAADKDASQTVTDATGTHIKDPFAHQCYAGALDFLNTVTAQNGGSLLPPAPVGVISAFQSGRDIVKGALSVTGGGSLGPLPPQLVAACGPLALDVQNDIGHVTNSLTLLGLHL